MTNFNPPHEVRDKTKLQSMIQTLKKGGQLPPVVSYQGQAYTGSHRIAAWDVCEMDAEAIEIGDEEFILALAVMNGIDDLNTNDPDDIEFFNKHIGYDVNDYNEFCEALLKVSRDVNIINAIKDQTG